MSDKIKITYTTGGRFNERRECSREEAVYAFVSFPRFGGVLQFDDVFLASQVYGALLDTYKAGREDYKAEFLRFIGA